MLLKESYHLWQDEYWTIPGTILESTISGYVSIFDYHLLPLIGENDINDIDYYELQKYYDQLSAQGYSPKTLRNINQALSSLLKWCWKKRFLKVPINLKELIVFPKKRGDNDIKNVISQSEYNELLKFMTGHYKYAIEFIANTGIRFEEIGILKENVDFEHKVIYIKTAIKRVYKDYKSKKATIMLSNYLKSAAAYRAIPMTPNVEEIIRKQLAFLEKNNIKSKFLFCNTKGNIIHPRNLLRYFHVLLKKAGLPKRGLHSLRKLYITRMFKNGMDPKILQKIVGHEEYSTTMKYYANVTTEDILSAAFDIYNKENI